MKTPMQELLEWVRETLPMDLETPRLITPRLIEHKIESLLEKEREMVVLAHINGQSEFDNGAYRQEVIDNAEEYYNETFNTNER